MDTIDKVIKLTCTDYKFILADLKRIKKQCASNESIDVRLCIETEDSMSGDAWTWIIRSGDASFDQRHSPLCGASSIDRNTKCESVIEDLINQCCDQAADMETK